MALSQHHSIQQPSQFATAANSPVSEWINPAPIEIERELVPNKYGGYDSVPTPDGQAKNYNHLREFRQELAALHLSKTAEVAIAFEDDGHRMAAD